MFLIDIRWYSPEGMEWTPWRSKLAGFVFLWKIILNVSTDLWPHQGNVYVGESPVCDDGWGQEEARVTCRYHEHFPNTQKIHIIILSMLLFFHQPCQKDAGIFCWNSRGLVILRNCKDRRAVLEVTIYMSLFSFPEIVMLECVRTYPVCRVSVPVSHSGSLL